MKKKLLVISALLASLTACNDDKATVPENNVPPDSTSEVSQTATPETSTTANSAIEEKLVHRGKMIEKMKASHTLRINNQEFKLLSETLEKGANVFNKQLKETGTVKGTVVVVTTAPSLSAEIIGQKIAANTFRVTPNKGQSLLDFYNDLTKDDRYSTVELEVDYSPLSDAPAM